MSGSLGLTPASLKASGRSSENVSLLTLQGKIKRDPEGYETELQLIYKQFKTSVDLFHELAALSFSSTGGIGSDPSVSKDLGDRAMFLAHVTPFYPKQLAAFPAQLTGLLRTSCLAMPSGLRNHVAQALILLMNRKVCAFIWIDWKKLSFLTLCLWCVKFETLKRIGFVLRVFSLWCE